MGYGTNNFVCNIDQNLICPICSGVLEDAVLTPCGHSFCFTCLETWLARPGTNTCPECRSRVAPKEARPIHSVRNLINSLNVTCKNSERGCSTVIRLEKLKTHLDSCGYTPVECAGCGMTVNKIELAGHQIGCAGIAEVVNNDIPESAGRSSYRSAAVQSEMACRVASMELQMKRMKRDLESAEAKNKKLERELKKTKEELQDKRNQLLEQQFVDFDPDYEYGYAPHTVNKLSTFISKFLLRKPPYVDRNRIFSAIKRCYEQHTRPGLSSDDAHMLIATANASNWFTDNQKIHFQLWMQNIARNTVNSCGRSAHISNANQGLVSI